jgi:putative NADH-flavin reductase
MKIAVFGATGGTGRQVLTQALSAGHDVSVLVRDRARLTGNDHSRLHVVVGTVQQQHAVDRVIRGRDVVISALGTGRGDRRPSARTASGPS